jgi:hypothetical protein
MGLIQRIQAFFNWNKSEELQNGSNPIKQEARRPYVHDWTDSMSINAELTRGIWHNSYPGLKLAGALGFIPISVPLRLMGLPIPKTDNETRQKELTQIVLDHEQDCNALHLVSHREGTVWVFPFFSSKLQRDVWDLIPDESICDIIRDIETGEVVSIITDEQMTVSIGYNKTADIRRKRTFTKQNIIIKWLQGAASVPGELKSVSYRNILGILPIPFANNKEANKVRGHSDFERILTDLKNYHDVDLATSELLTKFSPKWVQYVQDVEAWKGNNGVDSLNDIDTARNDFVLNLYDKEKTEVLWPEGAHEAGMAKLNQIYWKLVQGSSMPEMLWGLKVEGNMASADNQLDSVINFVKDKQAQKNEPYKKLILATARLRNLARMSDPSQDDIKIEWNALELIPEATKATIFQNFAAGIASLVGAAGFTKEMLQRVWKRFYPQVAEDDLGKFIQGIGEMARHKSYAAAPYENIMDLKDWEDTGEPDQV